MFDKLLFPGPFNLGDMFVVTGAIHEYARRCKTLYVSCNHAHVSTVSTLFKDFPHICVVPLQVPEQVHDVVQQLQVPYMQPVPLSAHLIALQGDTHDVVMPYWCHQTYEHLDVSYRQRYAGFHVPTHVEGSQDLYDRLTEGDPNYYLVHRCMSTWPQGVPINIEAFRTQAQLPARRCIEIQEGITDNLLQYVDLIRRAPEIHCVPSSVFCLIDGMQDVQTDLMFYHDCRKRNLIRINSPWSRNVWQTVHYGEKF